MTFLPSAPGRSLNKLCGGWVDTQGLSHATQAYLLGPGSPGYSYANSQAPQTLLPIGQKQSPKQMYANYRLQGRPTHLLNRSSPQTSPTTLPTPQPPTPGVASRRKELKFHLEEAVPLAKTQPPLPCLPLQHTGPGERSGFSGKGGEGWGSPRKRPSLVSSLALSQGKPAQIVPASMGVSGGWLLSDKEWGAAC